MQSVDITRTIFLICVFFILSPRAIICCLRELSWQHKGQKESHQRCNGTVLNLCSENSILSGKTDVLGNSIMHCRTRFWTYHCQDIRLWLWLHIQYKPEPGEYRYISGMKIAECHRGDKNDSLCVTYNLYFFTGARNAQVACRICITLVGQLGQSGQE